MAKGWSFGALIAALKAPAFSVFGSVAGTVVQGNDPRVVNALSKVDGGVVSNNLGVTGNFSQSVSNTQASGFQQAFQMYGANVADAAQSMDTFFATAARNSIQSFWRNGASSELKFLVTPPGDLSDRRMVALSIDGKTKKITTPNGFIIDINGSNAASVADVAACLASAKAYADTLNTDTRNWTYQHFVGDFRMGAYYIVQKNNNTNVYTAGGGGIFKSIDVGDYASGELISVCRPLQKQIGGQWYTIVEI